MSEDRKPWYRRLYFVVPILLGATLVLLFLPGAGIYHRNSGGQYCTGCHEIFQPYTDWHTSTHRNVPCSDCHGDVFTFELGFHLKNIQRLTAHLRGVIPEQVRLKNDDVLRMSSRCQKCHQQEYAEWAAGPHAVTYKEIFLDTGHNHREQLMDDCLRCHAMHFNGGIRDLVIPLDTKGPWQLRDPKLEGQPVIPCLACHQTHRQGTPLTRAKGKRDNAGSVQELSRSPLALFDRRELDYVVLERLPLPTMHDGDRSVKISPDTRQALCYQCHAPLAAMKVASGDDRTPVGVHEGLSCFACHQGHGQKARASCATCHPKLSNCGLNVETMDTTFKSAKSPHNIHFVKCIDCHAKGIPKKKATGAPARVG